MILIRKKVINFLKFNKEWFILTSQIQVFNNSEFGQIRTIEINNEPWFVGKDVAEALGYNNTRDAIISHVHTQDKRMFLKSENPTLEMPNRGMTVINESGLYSLIMRSHLPNAEKFQRWVTSEILPSIRKTGGYNIQQNNANLLPAQIMAEELKATENIINSLEKMGVDTANARLLALKMGVNKAYKVLDASMVEGIIKALPPAESPDVGMLTPTDIARHYSDLYGEKITARTINIILENQNLQRKINGKWTPTEQGKKYASVLAYVSEYSGHNGWQLKWRPSVMSNVLDYYMEDNYGDFKDF
jgi:prophage antirepressor-like protein